jgi:RNA-directed DNA polymerase
VRPMVQKLDIPKSESELEKLQDFLFYSSKEAFDKGTRPKHKGLLEIISSETVILTAIHKLKGNRGSNTPGSDGQRIREAILERGYAEVINEIQDSFVNYRPQKIRRVWIPKPGKKEKRPLGIPAIHDRVIQQCVKIVLEPILESQFFKHSYGFRPMREAGMVMQRLQTLCHTTKYHWVVEGDISKFFDNVNHTILLKRLYGMGIRDRRVLMIIKEMLKAGIMNETFTNELGTPQGGIISPLLANVYLDALDHFVAREWEEKVTRKEFSKQEHRFRTMKTTNLKPAYFVRYADDWVLLTNSKTNAMKWKNKIKNFLEKELKLELSDEKTLVTNIRRKSITFLGFDFKLITNDGKKYISRSIPNKDSFKRKIIELKKDIRRLPFSATDFILLDRVNKLNSKTRGILDYYQNATYVYHFMKKYHDDIKYSSFKALKRRLKSRKDNKDRKYGWVKATQTYNLVNTHKDYPRDSIPAFKYNDNWIGITSLSFVKYKYTPNKNQDETPFSPKGRILYAQRSNKKTTGLRADELLSESMSNFIRKKLYENPNTLYNFEYFLNRPYAYNRDKGKCRVCGEFLKMDIHIHHISPALPTKLVNRVVNLASVHSDCHILIHSNKPTEHLGSKISKKITVLRGKLGSVI